MKQKKYVFIAALLIIGFTQQLVVMNQKMITHGKEAIEEIIYNYKVEKIKNEIKNEINKTKHKLSDKKKLLKNILEKTSKFIKIKYGKNIDYEKEKEEFKKIYQKLIPYKSQSDKSIN